MDKLPMEIMQRIARYARDSLSNSFNSNSTVAESYELNTTVAIKQNNAYIHMLLELCRLSRSWATFAQSELFQHVTLVNERKTELMLKLLRRHERFRSYARNVVSIRFGSQDQEYDKINLNYVIEEIGQYCINVIKVTCIEMETELEHYHNFENLRQIHCCGGTLLSPQDGRTTLKITSLSTYQIDIPYSFDPAAFVNVRTLRFSDPSSSFDPLLPQITSIHLNRHVETPYLDALLKSATSLSQLSIHDIDIPRLYAKSLSVIKDWVETLRVTIGFGITPLSYDDLIDLVGSCIMLKKLIIEGSRLSIVEETCPKMTEVMTSLKKVCKKKKIELWKEEFSVNGRVELK